MEPHVYQEFNRLEDQHWWFRGRRNYLESLIRTTLGLAKTERGEPTLEFCEVGSGTGGNLPMLSQFAIVDVVEMNDEAREIIIAKKLDGIRSIFSGFLPDNMTHHAQYDAVFSLDVIEHIDDDRAALLKLADYLKQDAWLITTVPAYQWLWSAHDDANHHKRRYTKTNYCELLRSAGYEIHYSSYFNTLLFPLAAISRLIGRVSSNSDQQVYSGLSLPAKPINTFLQFLFRLESYWAARLSMPFGLSIVVVAKKTKNT
ncbi:MAG: SAM-dependent methyltransferase [Arenicella sp.]|jgi:SAM-dependent methyltransferase